MTTRSELREQHEREAVRLRSLAATVTTGLMRARLLDEAEKHRRLADADEVGEQLVVAGRIERPASTVMTAGI